MKKIPTLFVRKFENHRIVECTSEITPGCEEVFLNGFATIKIDGACCAIIDGELYKRYDAKKGKKPPEGAIPCCDPDPITGHHPHWLKVDRNNPADRWFVKAYDDAKADEHIFLPDATYEAVGKHFNNNPYNWDDDCLVIHGEDAVKVERTYDGVKKWLENNDEEGLVFWLNGEPVCKIKRSDFGLPWPIKDSDS